MKKILLAIILLSSTVGSLPDGEDALLIRQVVPTTTMTEEGEDDANAEAHFASFQTKFGKKYSDEEERLHRLSVFKANLRRAKRHQKMDPTAVHGVTQFSDLTPSEFRRRHLGLRRRPSHHHSVESARKAIILPTYSLPARFDWRDHGAVTRVKDQGTCGSCWSFSAAGAMEGGKFLATGELVSLSEQQLVDCDHVCDPLDPESCDTGCDGGLMTNAFEYVMKSGGLQREKDYPYMGSDGKCRFDKSKVAASVSNFSAISVDDDQIAANLVKHGPLAVGINDYFMQSYIGGLSCPLMCGRRYLNHGMLLVGYGSEDFPHLCQKNMPYWILKNSWGESWGEKGYYKICRGRNVCGVESMVSTVAVAHSVH
ncbi:Cysteine proteinase 1 [Acorus calamus]|uniref:Cysteine proteinase 1 n=1 Tax=Acorus calamus TaxID=4465 RepID=A0AAV9FIA6_ACOCL|nr:Cysteine proteinase 1 [Acorus calamus]